MLLAAPGQRRVAAWEKHQMVEICALQAKRLLLFHSQQATSKYFFATLRALGVPEN